LARHDPSGKSNDLLAESGCLRVGCGNGVRGLRARLELPVPAPLHPGTRLDCTGGCRSYLARRTDPKAASDEANMNGRQSEGTTPVLPDQRQYMYTDDHPECDVNSRPPLHLEQALAAELSHKTGGSHEDL
jgi:hypothetical protein